MRKRHLAISLVVGLALALALTWVLAYRFNRVEAAPSADTRYVTTGGSDAGNDCTTQSTPCRTVQHAVDVANPDDIIKVAAGTYDDLHERGAITQVVYISKTVTIRGGYTTAFTEPPDPVANPTVLDAQGEGRVVVIAPPVDEATPTPAAQSPEGPFYLPRRVDATAQAIAPVVEGFHITGGDASDDPLGGGGVLVGNAEAELNDNWIYSNAAGTDSIGGGVCVICVYDWDGQQPIAFPESTLRANRIYSNSAGEGSGIALLGTAATLINNTVVDNSSASYETLVGCGVFVLDSTSRMWHTTIASNTAIEGGTGVCVLSSQLGSYAEMTNTIVADHAYAGVVADQLSSATLNGVLWHGNGLNTMSWGSTLAVTNEYTGTPKFALDGYHLTSGSAAIDRGVSTTVDQDIDGQIRPMGNGPDLGADEYPVGNIVIEKTTDPPGGTGFGFTDTITAPNAFTLSHGERYTFTNVAAGTYTVTEDDPGPNFDLTGLTCVEDVATNSSVSLGARQATIGLDPNETVTCIFTNTQRGTIVIRKETGPAGGTGFDFTGDLGVFSLDDQQSQLFADQEPGVYAVTETVASGWDLNGITCIGGDATAVSSSVTIHLDSGEHITCTFNNVVSAPPSGDATNSDGLSQGTYHPEDTVYVVGSGFVPSTIVHVHVVSDATWLDGMAIPPDLSGDGMNAISTGSSGSLGPVAIWSPPLVAGEYDVVFDANQNGIFDAATDAVHDPNHPGFVVQYIQTLVDPQSGGTLTYTDPQGEPTIIQFPPAAVTKPISICFSPLISPTYPLPVTYANHAFQLGACAQQPPLVPVGGVTFPPLLAPYREGDSAAPLVPYLPIILRDDHGGGRTVGGLDLSGASGGIKVLAAPNLRGLVPAGDQLALSSTVFDQPVTVIIYYSDSDVQGIDESNLILYYWTGSAWADAATTCSPTSTYTRDINNNVLQVEICHLSQFALGG